MWDTWYEFFVILVLFLSSKHKHWLHSAEGMNQLLLMSCWSVQAALAFSPWVEVWAENQINTSSVVRLTFSPSPVAATSSLCLCYSLHPVLVHNRSVVLRA